MAVPKMTRHEMKQDDLTSAIEKASLYVSRNPVAARNAGLVAAAIVLLGVAAWWMLSSRAAAAAELLREAQTRFTAPVAGEAPTPVPLASSYANDAERDRAALELFDRLVNKYGGRFEGRLGRYYQGILLHRLGRNEEAEAALSRFIEKAPTPEMAGVARAQLAEVRAARQDLDGAAKLYSDLSEDRESAYPRDFALYQLAGILERQGKSAEAVAAYKKVSTEFPNTPLATEADRHLK